jgi:hypothetical protein
MVQEKTVQKMIADYPWLINQNYETIPELPNQGLEYYVCGKRIDLLLRDRFTKRPIIIEFKAVPFYRENIGQIAEYKALIMLLIAEENTLLKDIFGNLLSCPHLCLVVPSCDNISCVACAITGIDVYEYGSSIHSLMKPEAIVSFDNFIKANNNMPLPFNSDRNKEVDKIYRKLLSVLESQKLQQNWIEFRSPNGEYWYNLTHSFINKWIFRYNEISIGIYEPVFENYTLNSVRIEYFSTSKPSFDKFIKSVSKLPTDIFGEPTITSQGNEHYYKYDVSLKLFIDKMDEIFLKVLEEYKKGMVALGKPIC